MAKKLSDEEFKERLLTAYKGEYIAIEEYINKRTKIKFIHNECNTEFEAFPFDLIRGLKKCPKCMREKLRTINLKDSKEFKKEFNLVSNGEYELLSDYKGSSKKIEIKHNKCNYIFEATPNNFVNKGSRCPKCFGNKKKTTLEFSNEVFIISDGEYEVASEYLGNHKSIILFHNECNSYYKTTPNKFLQGHRCTSCNETKGEAEVRKVLSKYKFNFSKQYRFSDCRGKKYPLPFDFAIFKDDKLICLIEYDGEQHFKPVNFKGIDNSSSLKAFEKCKHNDNIKNEYCKKNNIKLIRIPYFRFDDIENIIIDNMGIPSEADKETFGTCND